MNRWKKLKYVQFRSQKRVQQFQKDDQMIKVSSWSLGHLKSKCYMARWEHTVHKLCLKPPWTSTPVQLALDYHWTIFVFWKAFFWVLETWWRHAVPVWCWASETRRERESDSLDDPTGWGHSLIAEVLKSLIQHFISRAWRWRGFIF